MLYSLGLLHAMDINNNALRLINHKIMFRVVERQPAGAAGLPHINTIKVSTIYCVNRGENVWRYALNLLQ